ncbi:MAG TPA: lasso peptide biosynthesis B2 protein [Gammaproteobacteria bacterium]
MAFDARWTRVLVDDRRSLLYGPGTGRLYLLGPREAEDPRLRRVLGLAQSKFAAHLDDPAAAVAHDAASFRGSAPPRAPASLRAAYRLLDRTRSALPFGLAVRLAAAAGRRRARGGARAANGAGVDAIASAIHALERDVGYADCYPRALLTAVLALAAGLACRVAIGVLAPTRKMHAWCTVDGVVPYEPMPEHYLYRPLLVVSLDP